MAYCSERGWDKTNSSRSLAISLSLEANELLELYQWTEDPSGSVSELADELADILIWLFMIEGVERSAAVGL
ncbi:Uncharacterised protein [Mycobacteroides abscessus]|nr:Uncharacterised protein [Mycobacteroides abscessus]